MIGDFTPVSLEIALEQRCEKTHKPKCSVLFRRGEKATGIYVVLSGKVSLDLGFDTAFARSYGSGAWVGLPATLTKRDYSMTVSIIGDAQGSFRSPRTPLLL